ncbi:MAG: hypothetical protein DMG13_29925 [Acidobacteria bacterium]|nr:MAG: hypothetical protein DMG13_29925 [Acidobacteriota bacterium]
MKRIMFWLSFTATFTGAVFGQSSKLDSRLREKVRNPGAEKIAVIIQRTVPGTPADDAEVVRAGGKILRTFTTLKAQLAEVPVSQLEKLAAKPTVKRISIDEDVVNQAGEPGIVSGAALATQTYGVTGRGIGIAVIDSGIFLHQDLAKSIIKAVDFVNAGRTGGYDPFGHGTHVAGILAGSGANSGGVHKGVATRANLIDLRVLNGHGSGKTSNVIAAIEWAIANRNATGNDGKTSLNIRIINLSLGHRPYEAPADDPLTTICRIAVQKGIIVVAAAGNYGRDSNDNTVYGGITSPGNEPSDDGLGNRQPIGRYGGHLQFAGTDGFRPSPQTRHRGARVEGHCRVEPELDTHHPKPTTANRRDLHHTQRHQHGCAGGFRRRGTDA